jgi:RHS repeat-associated protein
MAGDKIKISGESYYNLPGGDPGSPLNMAVTDLLSALIGSPGMPAKGLTASDINSIGNNGSDILSTISFSPPSNTAKASISYMVFDEQFKHVDGGRDWVASGSGSLHKLHTEFINNPITITKSGYIYIYVSNQSNLNVYFDNLSVTHTPGPILETTDYYPFGLTMQGISSKSLNGAAENKIKFQGQEFASKEFSDGSGLDMYEFKWRMHDPQIGRFWQVDPLSDKYVYNSTYAFSENKVTSHVELEGLEAVIVTNVYDKEGKQVSSNTVNNARDKYGPLGNGTYTVNKMADGTFTEEFMPGEGNSVNGFYQSGLSQKRWIEGDDQGGFKTRLEGRLVEKMTEDALVSMGFDVKQVQKDVGVLESDDSRYKGKFASFAEGTSEKYTSKWEQRDASTPHQSTYAKGSGELSSTGLEVKFYSGGINGTPNQVGLVQARVVDHYVEAAQAVMGVNTSTNNARVYKSYQEVKKK